MMAFYEFKFRSVMRDENRVTEPPRFEPKGDE